MKLLDGLEKSKFMAGCDFTIPRLAYYPLDLYFHQQSQLWLAIFIFIIILDSPGKNHFRLQSFPWFTILTLIDNRYFDSHSAVWHTIVTLIGNLSFDSPFSLWFTIFGSIWNLHFNCQLSFHPQGMLCFTWFGSTCKSLLCLTIWIFIRFLGFDSQPLLWFELLRFIHNLYFYSHSWLSFSIFALIHHLYFSLRSLVWFRLFISIRDVCFQYGSFPSVATLTVDPMMDFHLLFLLSSAIVGLTDNLRFDSQSLLPFPINALIPNLCSRFQSLLSFTYFVFGHNIPLFREGRPTLPGYVDWHRFGDRFGPRSLVGSRGSRKIADRSVRALRKPSTER